MSQGREISRKCLFIPVNKCACTSMIKALHAHPQSLVVANRSFLREGEIHRDDVTPEMWEKRFSFAFVRNPFERLVSAWKMVEKKHGVSFSEVLEIALDPSVGHDMANGVSENIKRHTLPLSHAHYGLVDVEGRSTIDFIGRFEQIEWDGAHVCRSIGMELALPHLNKTEHRHYQTYYESRQRSQAERLYCRDGPILAAVCFEVERS